MSDEAPKPTLQKAISLFSAHPEEWSLLLNEIEELKLDYFSQFGKAPDQNRVMSISGGIGACDHLLQLFRGM